jgi:hypothetical protein
MDCNLNNKYYCVQTRTSARSFRRFASSLVVAEHAGGTISPATLSTIKAASAIGGQVNVLVLGHNVKDVADKAAKIAGVSKVLVRTNILTMCDSRILFGLHFID